jgi:predicted histone-like DNA-binding protein
MANYILKELPGEMTEGKTVIYPKMKRFSMFGYEMVIQHMCTFSRILNEGIIRSVFSALTDEMVTSMPIGHTVKIDGLGVFSLSLGFDTSTASEEDMALSQKIFDDYDPKLEYRHVCIKGINFRPDPDLLRRMNEKATFKNDGVEFVPLRKSRYSREERLAKAKEIIDKQGFMTLSDYAEATGLSLSGASRDLRQLMADGNSGIVIMGDHTHKIWVRSK